MREIKQTSLIQTGIAIMQTPTGEEILYPLFSDNLLEEVNTYMSGSDCKYFLKSIYMFADIYSIKKEIDKYGIDENVTNFLVHGYELAGGIMDFNETGILPIYMYC